MTTLIRKTQILVSHYFISGKMYSLLGLMFLYLYLVMCVFYILDLVLMEVALCMNGNANSNSLGLPPVRTGNGALSRTNSLSSESFTVLLAFKYPRHYLVENPWRRLWVGLATVFLVQKNK